MLPLFSGGHDSLSACLIAAEHPRFTKDVFHIDTGIGAKATRDYVEMICRQQGWNLHVYKSNFSYERFVRRLGFPGAGAHGWAYRNLKDRCISKMAKGLGRVALITGCRSQESTRRMGNVKPVVVGEHSKKTGKVTRLNRVWVSPCHNWSVADQNLFLTTWAMPRNPIKDSILGMSGECFCGAFARPYELDMIRQVCPDVAQEIDRLACIAKECGTKCVWGPTPKKGTTIAPTGPLCSTCDRKAAAAGLILEALQ